MVVAPCTSGSTAGTFGGGGSGGMAEQSVRHHKRSARHWRRRGAVRGDFQYRSLRQKARHAGEPAGNCTRRISGPLTPSHAVDASASFSLTIAKSDLIKWLRAGKFFIDAARGSKPALFADHRVLQVGTEFGIELAIRDRSPRSASEASAIDSRKSSTNRCDFGILEQPFDFASQRLRAFERFPALRRASSVARHPVCEFQKKYDKPASERMLSRASRLRFRREYPVRRDTKSPASRGPRDKPSASPDSKQSPALQSLFHFRARHNAWRTSAGNRPTKRASARTSASKRSASDQRPVRSWTVQSPTACWIGPILGACTISCRSNFRLRCLRMSGWNFGWFEFATMGRVAEQSGGDATGGQTSCNGPSISMPIDWRCPVP